MTDGKKEGIVIINARFHQQKQYELAEYEKTPQYKEYRRKWAENPKNGIVERVPTHIDIESTSVCNLRCVTCFQAYEKIPRGYMEMDLFKKIIDEGTEKGLCSIKLNYRGEPMLHPKIVDMVRYAKEKGLVEVMFNSNCVFLTEKMANDLIDAGLDQLICSVDGHTKETYEKIRIGAKFDQVIENIKNLQRIKKERGVERPVTRVQMVHSPASSSQVAGYLEFWKDVVDRVAITDMCDWTNKNLKTVIVSDQFRCPKIYQRMSVWFNGKVTICDGNYYGKLIAGDLTKQSIEEVWNGPVIKKMRETHSQGNSHRIKICAECGYRKTVIKKKELDSRVEAVGDPPYDHMPEYLDGENSEPSYAKEKSPTSI